MKCLLLNRARKRILGLFFGFGLRSIILFTRCVLLMASRHSIIGARSCDWVERSTSKGGRGNCRI